MISIIVPVYNSASTLPNCIESLLTQTYPDFEILLIDDGSKDTSSSLCDMYMSQDSRIRTFHKVNGGVSSARNLGIKQAKGEYITFCDANDSFEPDALSFFYNTISQYNPDIIRTGYKKKFASGKQEEVKSDALYTITDKEQVFVITEKNNYYGFLWNSCFKAQLVKKHLLDESISWCEDHIYSAECMADANLVIISPKITYIYNCNDIQELGHGNNLSQSMMDYKKVISIALKEKDIKMKIYKSNNEVITYANKAFESKMWIALYFSFYSSDFFAPLKIIAKYFNYNLKVLYNTWKFYIHNKYRKYIITLSHMKHIDLHFLFLCYSTVAQATM